MSKLARLKSRREFINTLGKTSLGLLTWGISSPVWALRVPYSQPEVLEYSKNVFDRIRKTEAIWILHNDTIKAKTPLDYIVAKHISRQDFLLRWELAYALSDLDSAGIDSIISKDWARFRIKHDITDLEGKQLAKLIVSEKLPLVPKPADVRPLKLDPQVKNTNKEKTESCAIIILEVILTTITGVAIAKDKLENLAGSITEPLKCMETAVKNHDWFSFENCLIDILRIILFGALFDLIKKELGKEMVKKILKFTMTRFLPIVGAVFAAVTLIFEVKRNWDRLEKACV